MSEQERKRDECAACGQLVAEKCDACGQDVPQEEDDDEGSDNEVPGKKGDGFRFERRKDGTWVPVCKGCNREVETCPICDQEIEETGEEESEYDEDDERSGDEKHKR